MSVSFSRLGQFGRIGNSLFQIACCIGYARKYNMNYVIPEWQHAYAFAGSLNQSKLMPRYPVYKEKDFCYNEIPEFKDVDLIGYFQSEKYFKHCEKEIRKIFEPNQEIKDRIKSIYGNILKEDTCAIHIRRGDYLQLSEYHNNLSLHYYNTAIGKINADKYLVFSDDIEWCKDKIHGDNVVYVATGNDIIDFFVMAECKNFIIANSSFSWWASYLSKYKDKRIIAPNKTQWFAKAAKHKNVDDLYLPNWEFNTKAAVIIFHKNIERYPKEWIQLCIDSIQQQTYKHFDVFELDYGGTGTSIYPNSIFSSMEFKDHAQAHNYLLDLVFQKGYDCAFNVNVDDFYSLDRFEEQIEAIEMGYDVVSSNFCNVNEQGEVIQINNMSVLDMVEEAKGNHNIIAHPVCCYSKKFWETCTKLRSAEIPKDDFELWKRSYLSGEYKFVILENCLLFYRVSAQKISAPRNRK